MQPDFFERPRQISYDLEHGARRDPLNPHGRAFQRIKDDFYPTIEARWIVPALLATTRIEGAVWEPHAGEGHLARELVNAGFRVVATDLPDYEPILGAPPIRFGYDFLKQTRAPAGVRAIVMNPPYKGAADHVTQAIRLMAGVTGGAVAALLRSDWSHAQSRRKLIHTHPGFDMKIELMKRPKWFDSGDEQDAPRHNFAWFVWRPDRPRGEPPRIGWAP